MNRDNIKRLLYRISALLLACFAIYLLVLPKRASDAVVAGLGNAYRLVIPSVFPFLVLSEMITELGIAHRIGRYFDPFTLRVFALPGCCASVIVMGLACGFPIGAKMTHHLYKRGCITREQAARLAAFTNFCGPSFVIGVLGGRVLADTRYGYGIFLLQTLLALTAGMILGRGKSVFESETLSFSTSSYASAFTVSVTSATVATLQVCGYVTFFSVFMSAVMLLFSFFSVVNIAPIYGFFEMSGGVSQLEGGLASVVAGAMIVFWGGVSVLMQIISILTKDNCRISILPYLAVRALFVPIGGILVYIIVRIFEIV